VINNFKIRNETLYAAGQFDSLGGRRARNLAHFEKGSWLPVAEELPQGYFTDLEFIDDTLYAVVAYDRDPPSGYVTGWDGHKWNPLGRGISLRSLSSYEDGPNEEEISSGPIAIRGGNIRSPMGSTTLERPIDFDSPHLLRRGNDLYLGGRFSTLDQPEITNLAVWSGGVWKEVEPGSRGFPHGVTAMALHEENVIVAWSASPGYRVERRDSAGVDLWNGSRWIPLARGIEKSDYIELRSGGYVRALAVIGNDLYLGGLFDQVNGIPSHGMARIDLTPFSSGIRMATKPFPKTPASLLFSTLVPSGSRAAGVFVSRGGDRRVFDLRGRRPTLPLTGQPMPK
jgi:trimeric autotransporter adhesin